MIGLGYNQVDNTITKKKKRIPKRLLNIIKYSDCTLLGEYILRSKESWTSLGKLVLGNDDGEAILKLCYLYYRVEQMSKYIDVLREQGIHQGRKKVQIWN